VLSGRGLCVGMSVVCLIECNLNLDNEEALAH